MRENKEGVWYMVNLRCLWDVKLEISVVRFISLSLGETERERTC